MIIFVGIIKASYQVTVGEREDRKTDSQLGLVHATHKLLQFDGHRHVSFDAKLPRHERHCWLQLP